MPMKSFRTSSNRRVHPYVRLEDAIQETALRFKDSSAPWDPGNVKLTLEDYRPGRSIGLEARVQFDQAALRAGVLASGTGSEELAIVASSRCASTRVNREILRCPFRGSEPSPFVDEVALEIDGASVAQRFDLSFQVCLAQDRKSGEGFPRHRWNVLAEKRFEIVLEPGGRQFPTEWVEFSKRGLPSGGLWHLSFNVADASTPPPSGVKVLLNQEARPFVELLGPASRRSENRIARNLTMKFIAASCASDLLLAVLGSDEPPTDDREERKDTLWPTIFRLCKLAFQDDWSDDDELLSLSELRSKYKARANEVETRIQDATGLRRQIGRLIQI